MQPEIQAVLDDLALYPDDIPDLLPDMVSDEAWEDTEKEALKSDWFSSDPASLVDQVAARTCWAMAALALQQSKIQTPPTDEALAEFITRSMQAARQQQIVGATGMTAFAVCQTLLWLDFYHQLTKPWIAPIFNDPAILPLLRGATLAGCVELEWGLDL